MNTGVYVIEHLASGKKYIGSAAKSFYGRWHTHSSRLRKGTHHSSYLQHAWDKYGEDAFEFRVVKRTTPEEAVDSEQAFIDLYQTCDPKHGYNIAPIAGSSLGRKHAAETLAKISAAGKGNKRGLGYKHTNEAKAKMSLASKGNKRGLGHKPTAETRAKLSAAQKLRQPASAETRAKISAAKKGRPKAAEHRAKLSAANMGHKPTAETLAKMSAVHMGNQYNLGRKHTAETRAKISAAGKLRKHTAETRAKMSAVGKKRHAAKKEATQHAWQGTNPSNINDDLLDSIGQRMGDHDESCSATISGTDPEACGLGLRHGALSSVR
jgi:group I intron endonuclease